MLRQPGRVVVGALLALVAFAGPAAAECAWVLWEETLIFSAKAADIGKEYQVATATSSEQECRTFVPTYLRGKARTLREMNAGTALPPPTVEESPPYVTWRLTPTPGWMKFRYFCLPDTVDPRGPKGGAR